jgi:phospholipid-binding lipoprotein MlaA
MKLIMTVFMVLIFPLLICNQAHAVSPSSQNEEKIPVQEQTSPDGTEGKDQKPTDSQLDAPRETERQPADDPDEVFEEESEGALEEEGEEKVIEIADPLYPWNKAMYHVNDKIYFWVLKPLARGYSSVFPEDIRLSVSNFFNNLKAPIRIVSSLLQLKMKIAGNELIRFIYNSTAGVGGLADAAKTDFDIRQHDEDIGQAIGSYGIGHGFYLVWPFLGPSSLRDTAGKIGDWLLNPVYYVNPVEASIGITSYDKVNETSFHIGDYEDLKEAAIDPYVSIRDAYLQHREKEVEE